MDRGSTNPVDTPANTEARLRVVVADDVAVNRRLLQALFRADGFDPIVVEDGPAAIAAVKAHNPAVVVLDLQMPGMNGIETLAQIRAVTPDIPVLILTAYGEIPVAVEAIRQGAADFLTRPIENAELLRAVRRAIARSKATGDAAPDPAAQSLFALMGDSDSVADVVEQVRQVAITDFTTLVLGETGTGKELIARALHRQSARANGPMVCVDCGAIPEHLLESELFGYERGAFSGAERTKQGMFEVATGGTLFLDEIGNLSGLTQAKLLRVLQEKQFYHLGGTVPLPVECRVIAATNEDLQVKVGDGRFRPDLYYRLAEFVIHLPPLRDRLTDISKLAKRFASEAAAEFRRTTPTLAPAVTAILAAYAWPGNVRELRNIIRQAVLRGGDVIEPAEVSNLLRALGGASGGSSGSWSVTTAAGASHFGSGASLTDFGEPPIESLKEISDRAVGEAERVAIVEALRKTGGRKGEAARLLKVDFKTLQSKMRRLGLEPAREDD